MVEDRLVRRKERHSALLASSILALAWADPAWAYLDPGTGWMILQGFLAAVAAAGVALGTCWSTVRGWFSRRPKPGPEDLPLHGQNK